VELLLEKWTDDSPISIEDAADRKPRAALFVLSSLSHAMTDPETIRKIADTTAYVDAQYANYAEAHPTE
jgi:hypothetical protein